MFIDEADPGDRVELGPPENASPPGTKIVLRRQGIKRTGGEGKGKESYG